MRIAAHFVVCLDRLERLRLEAPYPHIPEHRSRQWIRHAVGRETVERHVEQRLTIALDGQNRAARVTGARWAEADGVGANRQIPAIGVCEVRVMARGTRHVTAARQNWIPEQEPA